MTKDRTGLLLGLAVGIALGCGAAAAQEYSFKFQSSDPAGNPNFELQQGWTKDLAERTGGRVSVELLPVGSIVEHNETQDAIAAGILDGHITDTSARNMSPAASAMRSWTTIARRRMSRRTVRPKPSRR